jgi:two-component system sensor histidine kinase MprB
MSFRTRLTLAAALAVAVAVAAASAITYVVVRGELRSQIDDALQARAATTRLRIVEDPVTGRRFLGIPPPELGGAPGYTQLVGTDGETVRPLGESVELPVSTRDRAAAAGREGAFFSDAHVDGAHVRVLTLPLGGGYALQISRPLNEVDGALQTIRRWLLAVALGGVLLAAALGLVVARAALAPVRRLTSTAEDVTETHDLSRRIEAEGTDELSRMARTFNTMLAALEDSARAQRRLVSDASHELRTPLTSVRTNIEVLARDEGLPPGEREQILEDASRQLSEMSALVAELVELARGDHPEPAPPEDVRLDLVAANAIERTRRNWPGVDFEAELEQSLVRAAPAPVERALSNLLDNAAKWSPTGGRVEVRVGSGEVVVRDHGPGIADEDLPFVFDRFYRAPDARGMPGSGLGLAIVRQVAESSGGSVVAERAEGGGARLTLVLPAAAETPPGVDDAAAVTSAARPS